ncbi:glycogen debranching N-terminal domain-containing protein [Spirochaeta africana]|uniref:Glycogen debranching enzyme n=1 Tax=Spirochaeta africana (strain ATCC 700263 / DSM 8902 / Z-7692) TaxID=889378 RepID=H9UMS3_SPIAZ|nr:glycogen debranching N-terminal domain-containing protein [Spirochaeta africana]AFG38816.1 glycogen debranching enzyme [Spirochaeta africana DSM 8902]
MDFRNNIVLKENYTFWVSDGDGCITESEQGVYSYDTRFLSRYAWRFAQPMQTLNRYSASPNTVHFHYAWIEGPSQLIGVRRDLELASNLLTDRLQIENTSGRAQTWSAVLQLDADFVDMFEARGFQADMPRMVHGEVASRSVRFSYRDQDGGEVGTEIDFSHTPISSQSVNSESGRQREFILELEPGQQVEITVVVRLQPIQADYAEVISYPEWRRSFPDSSLLPPGLYRRAYTQAVDDLRALLLFTAEGAFPAAGIPWFVAAFGRDALITGLMLLPHQPETVRGILRYLARHQAQHRDNFQGAEPGKIMHELRFGELTRNGTVPHRPYYGTIDATPLFLILLGRYIEYTQDEDVLRELAPAWQAALSWMTTEGDCDGDGFLEYQGAKPGEGLVVQSWKDSDDSMMHADGSIAAGAIAPVEVQGYAYAAYHAAVQLYRRLGDADTARKWEQKAAELKRRFHQSFWLEDRQIYAMALDGEKRPLQVDSSNAGQLLFSGIVPDEIVPQLVETLFSDRLWSGWGIRTLGTGETAYNPVSYHNGSVWPHDTALIAEGLQRHGYTEAAGEIARALYDLAASQSDYRLPELIAGYPRTSAPPVPYPVACRPQAWDAAALIFLLPLM